MDASLDIQTISMFLIFILPGLISANIYRLLMPAYRLDWSNAILQGLFFSSVNFALFLPLITFIHYNNFQDRHPVWYGILGLVVLLIGPIMWPLILSNFFRSKRLMAKLQLPFPTAWDYFFNKREKVFVLIHLNNGNLVGGYYGANSYATSFPTEGDIYLEAVYAVDKNGKFGQPIKETKGLLIRKDQYVYLETFHVPKQ